MSAYPTPLSSTHPNDPSFEPYCLGCDANLDRSRCRCDDEEYCNQCGDYHRPSEDCPPEEDPIEQLPVRHVPIIPLDQVAEWMDDPEAVGKRRRA